MSSRSCSRPFPGFNAVFQVGEPGHARFFRAKLALEEDAFEVTRGEVVPKQPVRADWMMGGQEPVDVIRTGYVAPALVSDRLLGIFREKQLTGWSTYEVKLYGKNGAQIPGYSGLIVVGRCGPLDESRSVEVPRNRPSKLRLLKGLYFDPATWDGSDFFMAEGKSGWIFITEQVKTTLKKAKVKNIELTALSEVERLVL